MVAGPNRAVPIEGRLLSGCGAGLDLAGHICQAEQADEIRGDYTMKLLRVSRWVLLALLLSLVPASSFAGVFISVGFAPPVLPVYEQPPCPQPGLMWTPGYWAYGPDGYYWVPGAWAPAPYVGALWTPPYWGWSSGLYVFHPGYWGQHVGYYGGVNYGFGYMGVGFVGGAWHGHDFAYNTAVVHVNNTIIHNTYIDRTVVEHNTIINDRRVAYSGGPGGIRHDPRPEERVAMNEHHQAPTQFQEQRIQEARGDRAAYVKNNGGHPQNLAVAHPANNNMPRNEHMEHGNDVRSAEIHNQPAARPAPEPRPGQQSRPQYEQRPAPAPQHQAQMRPEPERNNQQPRPEAHPAPQQQRPESHPAPQHEAHQAHEQNHPQQHDGGHGKGH
jgi:WXXGXW repeat (2 copies)